MSLDSGTQGHGLDQDLVIEGFGLLCGVYETHTTDRRLQSVVLGPVVEQCVSVMSESHLCPGRLSTPGEMHTLGPGYKSIPPHKGLCKRLPVPIAVKIRKKR